MDLIDAILLPGMKLWFFMNILVFFILFWSTFQYFPLKENLWFFVYVIIDCVGVALSTLMSISEGLDPTSFCRKMEKGWSTKKEIDAKVFISARVGIFPL